MIDFDQKKKSIGKRDVGAHSYCRCLSHSLVAVEEGCKKAKNHFGMKCMYRFANNGEQLTGGIDSSRTSNRSLLRRMISLEYNR